MSDIFVYNGASQLAKLCKLLGGHMLASKDGPPGILKVLDDNLKRKYRKCSAYCFPTSHNPCEALGAGNE